MAEEKNNPKQTEAGSAGPAEKKPHRFWKSALLASAVLLLPVAAGIWAYNGLGKEREIETQYCRFDPEINKEMFEANRKEQKSKWYYKKLVFHEGEREAAPLYGAGWHYDKDKYPVKKYHWTYTAPARIAGGMGAGLAALLLELMLICGAKNAVNPRTRGTGRYGSYNDDDGRTPPVSHYWGGFH